MTESTTEATAPQYQEVTINRFIAAPRELVFRAWTSAAELAKWWGPAGFTNPVCEFDPQPEGAIYIEMQGPDGVRYPMSGKVLEITPPERLVFSSSALDAGGQALFDVLSTIVLSEQDGGTQLSLQSQVTRCGGPDAEAYLAGMSEGWKQTIDRLAEYCSH
jgi:uncharacterized protein YndB with AHSA1/START domain